MPDAGPQGRRRSPDEPGFDEVLDRLRSVVERLEGGKLTLEESLAAYEEGVTLARRGHTLLDRAEKRVEVLVRAGGAGGAGVEVVPFELPPGPTDDEPVLTDEDEDRGDERGP